ncbi:hypothetical protein D3C80_2043670 [compost metagenome]
MEATKTAGEWPAVRSWAERCYCAEKSLAGGVDWAVRVARPEVSSQVLIRLASATRSSVVLAWSSTMITGSLLTVVPITRQRPASRI